MRGRRTVSVRATAAVAVALAALFAASSAFGQAPMEPNRAGRIRVACEDARGPDTGHYVVAGALVLVGVGFYVPNIVDSTRGDIGFFEQGVGLGLVVGGAVLALRPYGAGGLHLVETCERLTHPRDIDNPVVLRDAERLLNSLAVSQRTWDLAITLGAAVVSVGGIAISALLFNPSNANGADAMRNASQQRAYYAGAFAAVPIGFLLDLVVLAPPVRAAVTFHGGGYRAPRPFAIAPTMLPGGAGIGLSGAF